MKNFSDRLISRLDPAKERTEKKKKKEKSNRVSRTVGQ